MTRKIMYYVYQSNLDKTGYCKILGNISSNQLSTKGNIFIETNFSWIIRRASLSENSLIALQLLFAAHMYFIKNPIMPEIRDPFQLKSHL